MIPLAPRAAWIRTERSAHARSLGAAQAFPLTGDGVHVYALLHSDSQPDAPALAEARYRDWGAERWPEEGE